MNRLTNGLRCPQCGTRFRVELHKMRVNAPIPCPSCGFLWSVTEAQAIRAHRLLEQLEYRERVTAQIPLSW
jgi:predicted Zn finger-like uncharacterized protein